jgi:hypothetical protein
MAAETDNIWGDAAACIQGYFAGDRSPMFAAQQEFGSAWELPIQWNLSNTQREVGWQDTNAAINGIVSDNSTDCATWNWVHIRQAGVPRMYALPESDALVGHHFDGDPVTDPVSYCPHSTVTYLIFGRRADGYTAVLGGGIKYGTIQGAGPCQGAYSSTVFPCNQPGESCGNNDAWLDTTTYPELWIGMLSWSHDHNHFFGGDPYTNVWWNSALRFVMFNN